MRDQPAVALIKSRDTRKDSITSALTTLFPTSTRSSDDTLVGTINVAPKPKSKPEKKHAEDDEKEKEGSESKWLNPLRKRRPALKRKSSSGFSSSLKADSLQTLQNQTLAVLSDENLPLTALCKYIDEEPAIASAVVVASYGYLQRKVVAPHRKILLKLRGPDGDHFWLQLERRPTSKRALVRGLGITPANDSGKFFREFHSAIDAEGYDLENKQIFADSMVTLGDLRVVIQAMGEVLVNYNLLSQNCWAFCSILQEQLGWGNVALFQHGQLLHQNMSRVARLQIRDRIQQIYHIPDPITIPVILNALAGDLRFGLRSESIHSALESYERWATSGDLTSFKRADMTPQLVDNLTGVTNYLHGAGYFAEAATILCQAVILFRRSAEVIPEIYRNHLATFLLEYGYPLQSDHRVRAASSVREEALALKRSLYRENPAAHKHNFPQYFVDRGLSLFALDQYQEACEVEDEAVRLTRNLYDSEPSESLAKDLVRRLSNYSATLRIMKRHEMALSITTEAVTLARELYASDEDNASFLADALRRYGQLLYGMEEIEEACDVEKEAVQLLQGMADESPRRKRDLAEALSSYSASLREAERYEEAEEYINNSITIWRALFATNEGRYREGLASALTYLGTILYVIDRYEEAAVAEEEACRLTRRLYELYPDEYSEEHARRLANYVATLRSLEEYETGRVIIDEAIEVWRKLHAENPEYFRDGLAQALSRSGALLYAMRQYEEACIPELESVELTRLLYQRHPKSYTDDLASRTSSYSQSLRNCGKTAEARVYLEESVRLRRERYEANPKRGAGDLADALARIGVTMYNADEYEDTYKAEVEALQLTRELYEANPAKHADELAKRTWNYSKTLKSLDRHEEELEAILEAVKIWEEDPAANPDGQRDHFASALARLGVIYYNDDDYDGACRVEIKAVDMTRIMYEEGDNLEHHATYASRLSNYAASLRKAERYPEARDFVEQSIVIRRNLYDNDPDVQREDFADLLERYGLILYDLKEYEETAVAENECLDLTRILFNNNPDKFIEELAKRCRSYSKTLKKLSNDDAELEALREAVVLWRTFALEKDDEWAHAADMANSLARMGVLEYNDGNYAEACVSEADAVSFTRHLHESEPDEYAESLASRLSNFCQSLNKAKRFEDALAAEQEAIPIRRALFTKDPDEAREDLSDDLTNLGLVLYNLDRHEEAAIAEEEAVGYTRELSIENPDKFIPKLAKRLWSYSQTLRKTHDRLADERAALEDSVKTFDMVPDAKASKKSNDDLASALSRLGTIIYEAGDYVLAGEYESRCVDITRVRLEEKPDDGPQSLAERLSNWAESIRKEGRAGKALHVMEQSLDYFRQLHAKDPDQHADNLATAMTRMGLILFDLDRHADAAPIEQQCLGILEDVYLKEPEKYGQRLVDILSNYAVSLQHLKRFEEGTAHFKRSVLLARGIFSKDKGYRVKFYKKLDRFGAFYEDIKQPALAVEVYTEVNSLLRQLYKEKPKIHGTAFLEHLRRYAAALKLVDRGGEAEKVVTEADKVSKLLGGSSKPRKS